MQRKSTAAICLLAIAMLLACSQNSPPNSLFDSAGYHVKDGKVYYLNAFPGKAFEMTGADADAGSFELLDRPNFAKDSHHVYQHDRVISDDPAHFVLLDGDLAKDSHVVYWSDGSVLSEDPAHFAIISNADNYLFTKDGSTVHVNGKPIAVADPSTFQVLQGAYAVTANVSSTSTSRSPMRICRPSASSTVPTRVTPPTSTGWARPSPAPIRAVSRQVAR
jgi:DKNYY family